MSAPEPSLLPGQSPPFFTVTPTDQAGVIVNVAAICLVFALASILIRAYVRFEINRQSWSWDDGVVVAALASHLVQASFIFYQIKLGLGKAIDRLGGKQIVDLQRSMYADDIFYIAAVWISKLSYTLLFARISGERTFSRTNRGLTIGIALTAVASILLLTIRCDLSHPWLWFGRIGSTCTSFLSHWQAIAALDIVTEVLLAAMSVYLIWPVQIPLSRKATVVFAFCIRLAVIAPIACHLHYVSKALASRDPSLQSTSVVICKEVEIAFAIVAANIPTLRPFIFATTTNYGAPAEGLKTSHAKSATSGNKSGPKLFSLKNRSRQDRAGSSDRSQNEPQFIGYIQPSTNAAHADVTAGRPRSSGSNDSKQIIIRKDYSVSYYDESFNQ